MSVTGLTGVSVPACGAEFGDGTEINENTEIVSDSNSNVQESKTEKDVIYGDTEAEDDFTDGVTSDEAIGDDEVVDVYSAQKSSAECIAKGNYDNLTWTIDKEGCLSVKGTGGTVSPEEAQIDFAIDGWFSEGEKIKTAIVDVKGVKSTEIWFYGCDNLKSIDFKNSDFSCVRNLSGMFGGCQNLKTLNLNNFNTSKVTDMSNMFNGCTSLTSIELSGFDTAKVTNMSDMFSGCENLKTLNVSTFNTSRVKDMSRMFLNCENLQSLNLSKFVVSSCKKMEYMLEGCGNLTSIMTIPGLSLNVNVPMGIFVEGDPNLWTGLAVWVDSAGNKYTTLPKNKKESITLTRKKKGESCTVIFNPNGGKTSEKTRTISVGDVFGTLPTAKKKGFYFVGWYTDIKNGNKVDVQTKVNNKGKITLYAHWSKYPNINTAIVSVEKCTYNGNMQKPSVTVKIGNKILKENRDFKVKYSNNMDAGTGKINIRGIGNYCGSISKKFTIKPLNIDGKIYVQLDKDSYIWDGKNKKPEFEVYIGRTLPGSTVFRLESGKDYRYKYKNNKEPGNASLIINGIGNYNGTKIVSYKINKKRQPAYIEMTELEKTYKDIENVYPITVSGKKEGAKVTYTSSNRKVAEVDQNGKIVLKGVGKAIITVKVNATRHYDEAEKKIEVCVLQKQKINIDKKFNSEIGYTEEQIPINAMVNGDGKLTYKSLNTDIAEIDVNGMIKCNSTGKVAIQVTAGKTEEYAKTTKKFTFTIVKGKPLINCPKEINKNVFDAPFNLEANTGAEKVTLSYKSNAPEATVDKEGKVTLHNWEDNAISKDVQITIVSKATRNYESATATITLKISKLPPDEIYLKQHTDITCTLCSAVMMLRRKAWLNNKAWKDITEEAVEPIAWINGTGLTEEFAYEKMSVKRGSLKDISDKKAFLISMLNEHPEGIVIYENTKGKDKQHAVLLTDYTNEKFYSADPDRNYKRPKGRIALTDTYIAELCGKKENQDIDPDIIINSLGAYWYIEK